MHYYKCKLQSNANIFCTFIHKGGYEMIPYTTEPLTDFSVEENRQAYQEALKKVQSELGKDYPLIIGGERITTEDKIVSYNPAKKNQVVGNVSKANQELAEKAMKVADETFKTWSKVEPEVRADILFKAAAITKRRRHEMSAWMTIEAGKPWTEADADTAEAIDFMEYYGRQMLELKDGKPVQSRPGEYNKYRYIP